MMGPSLKIIDASNCLEIPVYRQQVDYLSTQNAQIGG